ncbi:hypothetical protein QVD17_01932 [Tagetes erecta]|uniref:Uncharacterized protein n=1 Tax=Tagetes erecta TaxID=13708 RepID=A0AAD8P8P6_TARER|nr:hypothetical protein QVD17_01932 [Tagetes erecta]
MGFPFERHAKLDAPCGSEEIEEDITQDNFARFIAFIGMHNLLITSRKFYNNCYADTPSSSRNTTIIQPKTTK